MICLVCGKQNAPGTRFCTACGTMLAKEDSPTFSDSGSQAKRYPRNEQARRKTDPLIGQTLDSKYRLDRKIGEGGMGSVYRATRLLINDTVAVKVLHSDLVSDQQAVERFRREAQAAARLKHPNAVVIYDFGISAEGLVYLAMELVEGESLASLIEREGPLTVASAAKVLTQVCAALDEAHRYHIVHRDIKPDNIIISSKPSALTVKVLDFGIAKLRDLSKDHDTLTQRGTVVGTPQYMSPEQCMGEELDCRSDIYSLGVVLYEALTGVVPFNSMTPTAVAVQHVTQTPQSLRSINESLPPAVDRVVLHALEKAPKRRPQTAGELASEFMVAAASSRAVTLPAEQRAALIRAGKSTKTPEAEALPTILTHEQAKTGAQHRATPIKNEVSSSTPRTSPATTSVQSRRINNTPSHRAQLFVGIALMFVLAAVAAWMLAQGENQAHAEVETVGEGARIPAGSGDAAKPAMPPAMAYVPGGEFLMGGAGNQGEQRKITVKPFFIDLYEVTCQQYKQFVDATGYKAPSNWNGGNYPAGWGKRPVTGVSWDDADAYAKWAGKRLPLEEEWEFAARGSDGRRYPWGDQWKTQAANADTTSHQHVERVGTHPAGLSPFGAFDMAGNAWEWTATDMTGQSTGTLKVIRGGDWQSNRNQATTTFRRCVAPENPSRSEVIGFRCVKDIN